MKPIFNKKAYYDYEVLEIFEAGIILAGPEVKAVKGGLVDLSGSYVKIDKTLTPFLINTHVAPYPPAWQVQQNYDPDHSRKLLLQKKEINTIFGKLQTKGLTMIPLKVYNKGGLIKIDIGLCRGKKTWDKREDLKQKSIKKDIQHTLKLNQ